MSQFSLDGQALNPGDQVYFRKLKAHGTVKVTMPTYALATFNGVGDVYFDSEGKIQGQFEKQIGWGEPIEIWPYNGMTTSSRENLKALILAALKIIKG